MNTAVQLWEGQLSVITTPIPHVSSSNEVLVKVAFSGVCGTDIHIIAGEFPSSKCVILGHEFAGVVSEVGASVKGISLGDRVVINPNTNCGRCSFCTKGQPHFCKTGGISSTIGIWRNGGWSQYCRVPAETVHIVPPQVTLRQAALCEPYSCILHGFDMLMPLATSSDILICGAGIIGLLWSCLLHFHGYRKVTVSEVSERRRSLAGGLDLGYLVVHPEVLVHNCKEAQHCGNDKWGFDAVIDCTGAPAAIEQAIKWLHSGGKMLVFGCCPKNSSIKIDPHEVYAKELKIIGSLINPFTFPGAIQLVKDMAENYLNYEKLGISVFNLPSYQSALDALSRSEISKAVFEM